MTEDVSDCFEMGDYVFVPLRIWHAAPADRVVRFDTTRRVMSSAMQPFCNKIRSVYPKIFATHKWHSNH